MTFLRSIGESIVSGWLGAFLLTQLIEIPIYVGLLRCSLPRAFGASALTHPVIWFGFFHARAPGGYWERVIAAELFAVVFEAAYFRPRGRRRVAVAAIAALTANAASVAVGVTSRSLFGWP